jgi:hypothetical protein
MRRAARLLVPVLALLFSGCGYALMGHGIAVDPSIKRIGVPLFKDNSGKAGLDQRVTQKVIQELLKRHRFDVVQDTTGVDAIIDGQILRYQAQPVVFEGGAGARTQASRYEITLSARIKYSKVGAAEPIWEDESFTHKDQYDVGDAAAFFDREEQAIDRLTTTFAQRLVSTMLEAF